MTGIFIIARLGSTRLSQKHLINANGQSFIEWLAARFLAQFREEVAAGTVKLYITTSEAGPENKRFETVFAGQPDVHVFYGADDNIPLRQLQCALSAGIDNIISIDGDDILCSPVAAREVYKMLLSGKEMVTTQGLPLGMNAFGYQTGYLKRSLEQNNDAKLETGWGRIFQNADKAVINYTGESPELRFTLDYQEDADFFAAIIEGVGSKILTATDEEIISYVKEHKIYEKNASLNDTYWANFTSQKEQEQQ